MLQHVDAAAAGLTRSVARAAHAAPHTPTWAIVLAIELGVLVAIFWLALAPVSKPAAAGPRGRG